MSQGLVSKTAKDKAGMNNPNISGLSFSSSELEEQKNRLKLEEDLFKRIEEGDRDQLDVLLEESSDSSTLLQILLTSSIPNHDKIHYYESDVLQDALELLGSSASNLNAAHYAALLGDEDIASDILEHVARQAEEMDARKVLLEFMGKTWGDNNTLLHLASFQGMTHLVQRLLELGANANKKNQRSYRAVDCADDDPTRLLFLSINEDLRSPLTINDLRAKPLAPQQKIPAPSNTPISPVPPPIVATSKELNRHLVNHFKPLLPSTSSLSTHSPTKKKKTVAFPIYPLFIDLIRQGDVNEIKVFLEKHKGTNINYQTHMGASPLHICAEKGWLDLLNYLIKESPRPMDPLPNDNGYREPSNSTAVNGIFINPRDLEGWIPLHLAVSEGNLEMTKQLISLGADIEAINDDGESLLDIAEEDVIRDYLQDLFENDDDD